jgi:hypothetical protein
LKNVLGNFFVLKQVLLRGLSYADSLRIIAHKSECPLSLISAYRTSADRGMAMASL